jgi:hypothetical protein
MLGSGGDRCWLGAGESEDSVPGQTSGRRRGSTTSHLGVRQQEAGFNYIVTQQKGWVQLFHISAQTSVSSLQGDTQVLHLFLSIPHIFMWDLAEQ